MELATQATATKRRLKSVTISKLSITHNDVLIEQEGKRQPISLSQLIGKNLIEITATSSADLKKIDVSGWLNDGKGVAETTETKEVNLYNFTRETIVNVGFYYGKLNGKQRAVVSLETKRDVDNSKPRTKTIAFGMYVK